MKRLILCLTLAIAASASAGIKSPDEKWQCDNWEMVGSARNCTKDGNGESSCLDWKVDYVGMDCNGCDNTACGMNMFEENLAIPEEKSGVFLGSISKGFLPGFELHFTFKLAQPTIMGWSVSFGGNDTNSHLVAEINKDDKVLELRSTFTNTLHEDKEKHLIFKVMDDGSFSDSLVDLGLVAGETVEFIFRCEETHYLIFLNGVKFARYNHKKKVEGVTDFLITGASEVSSIKYIYLDDTC